MEKEIKDFELNPLKYCQVFPNVESDTSSNESVWHVLYYGPKDTPYENGTFLLEFRYQTSYPRSAPNVTVKTKVYHININEKGKLCTEKLVDGWNKKFNTKDVLEDIHELFIKPDPSAYINDEAIALYVHDNKEYNKIAIEWTLKFASNKKNENENENENENKVDDVNDNDSKQEEKKDD